MEGNWDEVKASLESALKDLPLKMEELAKKAEESKPKASRKVSIIGNDAIATITNSDLITIEFTDKEKAKEYFDSLELK